MILKGMVKIEPCSCFWLLCDGIISSPVFTDYPPAFFSSRVDHTLVFTSRSGKLNFKLLVCTQFSKCFHLSPKDLATLFFLIHCPPLKNALLVKWVEGHRATFANSGVLLWPLRAILPG